MLNNTERANILNEWKNGKKSVKQLAKKHERVDWSENMMEKHFVTFLSPGTLVHEQTEKPIASWNVLEALRMASEIVERYNAKPFAFYFTTRARAQDDLDSKVVQTSGRYYLGGKIETIQQVRERADPNEDILLRNMEMNGWDRVIVNTNSWKVTQPFEDDDVMLDMDECGGKA